MENCLKNLFYLTGIDQVQENGSFRTKTLWRFSLINFMYIYFIMHLQYWRPELFYYPGSKPLTAVIDFCLYNLPIFAHLIILLEAHLKSKIQRRLKETIKKIYEKLSIIHLKKPSATKILLCNFIALNGVCSTMQLMAICLAVDEQLRNSILLSEYSFLVKQLNDFYLIYYILQLQQVLKLIEKRIVLKNMKELGSILLDVYEAYNYLNRIFGCTILASVAANFFAFVIGAYWNVYALRSSHENFTTVEMYFCTFSPLINLCVLFHAGSRCMRQYRALGHKIHSLTIHDHHTVMLLSQQMLLTPVAFKVFGIFTLDMNTLLDVRYFWNSI